MKQINIFNQIDHIDREGKVKRCKQCKKGIEKGNYCSCRCVKNEIISIFVVVVNS